MEPHYLGYRDEEGSARVFCVGQGCLPSKVAFPKGSQDAANAIEWGSASHSAETPGLTILADHLNDGRLARRLARTFTESVIRKLRPGRPWQLPLREVDAALRILHREAV